MGQDAALKTLLHVGSDEKYVPGYWKAFPEAYKRDSSVYERLLEARLPEVAAKLQRSGVVAEAYVSKWFVGNCVHVLPFRALFDFYEAFLERGYVFLFQFALSLCDTLAEQLLAADDTDVAGLFALLRLDRSVYPDNTEGGDFFVGIVARAADIEVDPAEVLRLRTDEMDKLQLKLVSDRLRMAELAADEEEIVFSDDSDED